MTFRYTVCSCGFCKEKAVFDKNIEMQLQPIDTFTEAILIQLNLKFIKPIMIVYVQNIAKGIKPQDNNNSLQRIPPNMMKEIVKYM